MIAAPEASHAVKIAKKNPELNVGLHIVLSNGKSSLPIVEIPNLVNSKCEFSNNKFWCGVNYFFNNKARSELKKEIR